MLSLYELGYLLFSSSRENVALGAGTCPPRGAPRVAARGRGAPPRAGGAPEGQERGGEEDIWRLQPLWTMKGCISNQ